MPELTGSETERGRHSSFSGIMPLILQSLLYLVHQSQVSADECLSLATGLRLALLYLHEDSKAVYDALDTTMLKTEIIYRRALRQAFQCSDNGLEDNV